MHLSETQLGFVQSYERVQIRKLHDEDRTCFQSLGSATAEKMLNFHKQFFKGDSSGVALETLIFLALYDCLIHCVCPHL